MLGSYLHYRWFIIGGAILGWLLFHAWVVDMLFVFDYTAALWDALLSTVLLLIGTTILFNAMPFLPSTGRSWYGLLLSLIMAFFFEWLFSEAYFPIAHGNEVVVSFMEKSHYIRLPFMFVVFVAVSVSSYFYNALKEQREAARREAVTTSMVREAELQKLQQQLQPHFLFNCLNSINAMVTTRPEDARKMVQQLSDFLRTSLKRKDEQRISFRDEWTFLQGYLDIEKVRFGHRLAVETSFAEEVWDTKIPSMVLQPLVENAIKFGLYGTTDKVTISIDGQVVQKTLVVIVKNPFDQDMQPPRGSGFGISGLQRRLYLLFARNDLLYTRHEDNIFKVTLKIPHYD